MSHPCFLPVSPQRHSRLCAPSFQTDPRDLGKNVVLTVDSSSFVSNDAPAADLAKLQGSPHPIAWYQEGNLLDASSRKLGGGLDDRRHGKASTRGTGGPGRAMYTGLGHTKASWRDDDMLVSAPLLTSSARILTICALCLVESHPRHDPVGTRLAVDSLSGSNGSQECPGLKVRRHEPRAEGRQGAHGRAGQRRTRRRLNLAPRRYSGQPRSRAGSACCSVKKLG